MDSCHYGESSGNRRSRTDSPKSGRAFIKGLHEGPRWGCWHCDTRDNFPGRRTCRQCGAQPPAQILAMQRAYMAGKGRHFLPGVGEGGQSPDRQTAKSAVAGSATASHEAAVTEMVAKGVADALMAVGFVAPAVDASGVVLESRKESGEENGDRRHIASLQMQIDSARETGLAGSFPEVIAQLQAKQHALKARWPVAR